MFEIKLILMLSCLCMACFYLGHRWALDDIAKVSNRLLLMLEKDNIIRIVKLPNGEEEIYAGSKTQKE